MPAATGHPNNLGDRSGVDVRGQDVQKFGKKEGASAFLGLDRLRPGRARSAREKHGEGVDVGPSVGQEMERRIAPVTSSLPT
jgi:hypothetical protein